MFDARSVERFLHPENRFFDEEENLMCTLGEDKKKYHDICYNARYASFVICLKQEKYYQRAAKILLRVLTLQDTDESSPTYGVWACVLEEPLEQMAYVDYNTADFLAKTFLDILYRNPGAISGEIRRQLLLGLRRALESIIRRNIAPDYTNISIIGCMNLIAAGELLEEERYFAIGKRRLKKLYEYTKYTTGFSEYNSSDYALLDIEEIARMLDFFQDEECRRIAEELNYYAWDMLTSHFNTSIEQLSPPQSRAYINLEKGRINALIYLGTNGRYGRLERMEQMAPSWLIVTLKCPKACEENLRMSGERWIEHTYYRRNSIISPDEERAIILDENCPDMTARTYMTEQYSMGSFSVSDLWGQRRTCMVLWGKENPCYIRLRGMKDDMDFCSAMVYASQYKNTILAHVGFVTDRGARHYNIDGYKCTSYAAEKLCFKFELGGSTEEVSVIRNGNEFLFRDKKMTVRLCIWDWLYNGSKGEIYLDEVNKRVELICFRDKRQEFDLNTLGKTYGVFTIEVNGKSDAVPKTEDRDCMMCSSYQAEQKILKVSSCYNPIRFREAVEKSVSALE